MPFETQPPSQDDKNRLSETKGSRAEGILVPASGVLRPQHRINPADVAVYQRRYGNQAVQRMLAAQGVDHSIQRYAPMSTMDPAAGVAYFEAVISRPLQFERKDDNLDEGRIQARVDVMAAFNDDAQFDVSKYEYRQFIKGHVEMHDLGSGRTISLDDVFSHLPEGQLTDDWQEDGDTSLGADVAGYHYGHRDYEANDADGRDVYLPDRATGNVYRGYDYPEIAPIPCQEGDTGDSFTWRMNFRGEIRYEGLPVAVRFWNIEGSITLPDQTVARVIAS